VPAAFLIHEARRDLPCDQVILDRAPLQLRLSKLRKVRRTHQHDVSAIRKVANKRMRVFAAHRRLRAKHAHAFADGGRARRLDRRDGADEWNAKAPAQMRQHKGRGGITGDNNELRRICGDQLAHENRDAIDQLRLAMVAIGKESIVRDIDVMRVGSCFGDLPEHGETAKAGIEDQNGRCIRHAG